MILLLKKDSDSICHVGKTTVLKTNKLKIKISKKKWRVEEIMHEVDALAL